METSKVRRYVIVCISILNKRRTPTETVNYFLITQWLHHYHYLYQPTMLYTINTEHRRGKKTKRREIGKKGKEELHSYVLKNTLDLPFVGHSFCSEMFPLHLQIWRYWYAVLTLLGYSLLGINQQLLM